VRLISKPSCKKSAVLLALLVLFLLECPNGALGADQASPSGSPTTKEKTIAPPCAQGNALKGLERLDAAEAAYLEALKTESGIKCAVAPLEALGRREASCAQAEALMKAGQQKGAEEALVDVMKAEPNSTCAESLEGLEEAQSPWEWAATATKDALAVIAAFLLLLAILFIPVVLILRLLKVHFFSSTLQIKTLDDGGSEKKLGTGLTALIGGRITRHRDKGPDLVTGRASIDESLEPLGDISTEAKAAVSVVAAVAKLLPRENFDLSGTVQQSGGSGCGISLQLAKGNGIVDVATFWAKDFKAGDEDVQAYQRLSTPAAAWVDHTLAKALGNEEELPSGDARSWAFFEAGSERQEEGSEEEAAELYESALNLDPNNVGALANLGIIRTRNFEYDAAASLLRQARAILEGNDA
jgi:tetratricopeptide (TPR) repeat protein